MEDYCKNPIGVFSDIHQHDISCRLHKSKATMAEEQHKHASPVTIRVGEPVMVKVPERNSKLCLKFVARTSPGSKTLSRTQIRNFISLVKHVKGNSQ